MLKVTLKSLWAHKLRLGLTALAVVLGVGFISGTFVYTDTIGRAFDDIFEDAFRGVDIVVTGDSELQFGEGVFLSEEEVVALTEVQGVADLVPFIQGFGVAVLDPEGEPIGGQGPPQFAFSFIETEVETGGFVLREGRYPEGSGQVALDVQTAEDNGYEIGDTVMIISPTGSATPYTLVGLAGFGELDNLGGATSALFDLTTAQAILGRNGQLTGASLQVDAGADVDEVIARVEPELPEGAIALTGQTAAEQQAVDIQEGLEFFNTFLLSFGFIALFVGTFTIANTFRIIVAQRTRELALLRALGASARQVNRLVLIEAAVIGVVASVAGLFLGFGLALLLRAVLERFGIALPSAPATLEPRTIIVSLAVGIIVTLVSAFLPARKASRIPPIAALREDLVVPPRKALTRRAIGGSALTTTGLVMLLLGLFVSFESGPPEILYVGIGAAVIFIGISVLSPLVARPVARFIGWPFARLLRVPGKLAQQNAIRTPRRTSATAAALMIGVTLVTLASVMSASIRATIDEIVAGGIEADVVIRASNDFNPTASFTPGVAARVAGDESVAETTRQQTGVALFDETETFVVGIEPNYAEFFPADESTGTLQPAPGEVVLDSRIADDLGLSLGSEVEIVFDFTGRTTFILVGTATGDTWTDVIAVSQETWVENYGTESDTQVFIRAADGFSSEQVRDRLAPLIEDVPTAQVQTLDELSGDVADQLDQLLNLITGLLGLAVIVALIGVTNTMTLSVFERTREIGLLRAVGLSRLQTRRMVRSEASIIAIFGALLGIGIGLFFAWSVLQALAEEGFSGSYVVPFGTLAVSIIVIGLLGVVFAILPAWRASRLDVLEAIAYE